MTTRRPPVQVFRIQTTRSLADPRCHCSSVTVQPPQLCHHFRALPPISARISASLSPRPICTRAARRPPVRSLRTPTDRIPADPHCRCSHVTAPPPQLHHHPRTLHPISVRISAFPRPRRIRVPAARRPPVRSLRTRAHRIPADPDCRCSHVTARPSQIRHRFRTLPPISVRISAPLPLRSIRARVAWRPIASNPVPHPALRFVANVCRCPLVHGSSPPDHFRGHAHLDNRPQRSQSARTAAAATTSGLASRRPTHRQPSPDGTTSTAPAHGKPLHPPLWIAVPLLGSIRSPNRLRLATPPPTPLLWGRRQAVTLP